MVAILDRGRMAVVEVDPERFPSGHELGPNKVTKGWLPCRCVEGRGASDGKADRQGFRLAPLYVLGA